MLRSSSGPCHLAGSLRTRSGHVKSWPRRRSLRDQAAPPAATARGEKTLSMRSARTRLCRGRRRQRLASVAAALMALLPRLAWSQTAPPVEMPVIGSAQLPRDLSPWSMFVSADILVQSVMIGLVFASLVTWTVWLAKNVELWLATRRLRKALAALGRVRTLADGYAELGNGRGIAPGLVRAARLELAMSADLLDKAGIK